MLLNVFVWLVFVAVTFLLLRLTLRAWRARNAVVKWAGGILSSLLTLVLAALSVLGALGLIEAYVPRSAPAREIKVAGSPEQVERGQYLANSFCAGCHSETEELPLTGGRDVAKDIPFPIGSMVAPNLTPTGPLKGWSDADIFRALRDGVGPNGRRLLTMSLVQVRYMSDEDLLALIAYIRSQEPAGAETLDPPDQPNMLGLIMAGAGLMPRALPPVEGVISAPPKGATVEYGKYQLGYMDCVGCHGADLSGGTPGQLLPVGPSLRVVKGWTPEEFIATLRTGVDPSGHALKPELMPWKSLGRLDDGDLTAIYLYLNSLP